MTTIQLGGGSEPTIRISTPERERGEWPDHFSVEVVGAGITACVSVENPPYASALGAYFRDLASSSVAWRDTRDWQSAEGELSVRSTCDPTGHVHIEFDFRPGFGSLHTWRAIASVEVDLGSLGRIASEIEDLLAYAQP